MKIKINEKQLKTVVTEMSYPVSFSFDEFKRISSYNGKMRYCETHLQKMASGSARVVYKIDETKVLKLAKNNKGIAQNETEYGLSNDYYRSSILAQTFDFDEESSYWIEMELARKVKPNDFKQVIGYPINFIKFFINEIAGEYSNKGGYYERPPEYLFLMNLFYVEDMEDFKNWEWFNELADYLRNYRIPSGNITRISSWGLVNRNGKDNLVVIDFGLTDDVYNSYYN